MREKMKKKILAMWRFSLRSPGIISSVSFREDHQLAAGSTTAAVSKNKRPSMHVTLFAVALVTCVLHSSTSIPVRIGCVCVCMCLIRRPKMRVYVQSTEYHRTNNNGQAPKMLRAWKQEIVAVSTADRRTQRLLHVPVMPQADFCTAVLLYMLRYTPYTTPYTAGSTTVVSTAVLLCNEWWEIWCTHHTPPAAGTQSF